MAVIRKVTVAKAAGDDLEFVLSDSSRDRYNTVIKAAGWDLNNFRKNPIALFNHNSNFPIGQWHNVRVEGDRLLGKLKPAAKGTSQRIDELVSLIEQGILRATSVGFRPIERNGQVYEKQELLEASLVSVPGNSGALQIARSLNISDETIGLVFGEHASAHEMITRGSNGEQAAKPPVRKSNTMTPIAQRIEDAQTRLVALRDQLTTHLTETGDEPDDEALVLRDDINAKITTAQRNLDSLKESEASLAAQAEVITRPGDNALTVSGRRPFAVPAQKINPADYMIRAAAIQLVSHASKLPTDVVRKQRYGDDEATKVVFDVVTRAATAPADTTTSGWASQLVQTVNLDFIQTLMPQSVYPGLSARGNRFTFGRNGIVSIPSRSATPTVAGSFVAQGAPIPVRQAAFTSISLTPKKMGVISTFTREIAEHSTPAIEGLIRTAIQEDTAVAIDTVLLDATAASTTRPAGLRNGVAVTTATAGGGFAALVGDIKGLLGALITATGGNLRSPTWIMNPVNAISIALTQNAGGDFPFAAEINQNRLQGYPVVVSNTVTAGMVFLVDAADFVSATGDEPRFDVSDQAVLHMEDTTPLAIGTAGTPPTVAAPVRSLWQTDTIGLRMILDINWAFRRTGTVVWTQSVTW